MTKEGLQIYKRYSRTRERQRYRDGMMGWKQHLLNQIRTSFLPSSLFLFLSVPFLLQMKSNSNDIKKETDKRGRWSKTKGTSSLGRPLKLNRQELSPFQNNPEYLLVWDFYSFTLCVFPFPFFPLLHLHGSLVVIFFINWTFCSMNPFLICHIPWRIGHKFVLLFFLYLKNS